MTENHSCMFCGAATTKDGGFLPKNVMAELAAIARRDHHTIPQAIEKIISEFLYGRCQHLPPLTDDELAAYRRQRTTRIPLTAKERNSVFESGEGRCYICRGVILYDEPWHVDHIKPVSKGGTNAPENLAPACARCNLTKAAKLA